MNQYLRCSHEGSILLLVQNMQRKGYLTLSLNFTTTNQCLHYLYRQCRSSCCGAKSSVWIWFTAVEIFKQPCTIASVGQSRVSSSPGSNTFCSPVFVCVGARCLTKANLEQTQFKITDSRVEHNVHVASIFFFRPSSPFLILGFLRAAFICHHENCFHCNFLNNDKHQHQEFY